MNPFTKIAENMVEQMIKKGKITVDQGQQINEELRRKYDNTRQAIKKSIPLNEETLRNVLSEMDLVSRKDLDAIEQRLSKLEEVNKQEY